MPVASRILEVRKENFNTRTFSFQFVDEEIRARYRFAGQFNMVYVPGVGEAAISVSSHPDRTAVLEHTIRTVGSVTRAVERLGDGGIVGLRGPFGRGWPLEALHQNDVVIVAGGIGIAPLRPVIYWLLDHYDPSRRVVLLYGCRTPEVRVFSAELEQWSGRPAGSAGDGGQPQRQFGGAGRRWTRLLQRIKVSAMRTVVLVRTEDSQSRGRLEFPATPRPARAGVRQFGAEHELRVRPLRPLPVCAAIVCAEGPVFAFADIADIFTREDM